MFIVIRVLGILIIVLSLLLLLAVPPAGIVGIILGVLFIFLSSKKFSEKRKAILESTKTVSEQAPKKDQHAPKGQSVYIEYEDTKGDYSNRTIEIKRVYKKDGILYTEAYCYMADGMRTFRIDRILTMKDKVGGQEIEDAEAFFEAFLNQKSKKTSSSAVDLAASALES